VIDEKTDLRRYLILAICCMSIFIVGLDVTVMNVALPAIRRDFDSSVSQLQWTIDAYTVVIASLLVLAGSTADRLGRARIFKTGLTIFTLGSLLCSLAPNTDLLIASRALQAIGGSMLNPVAMSIIRNTFHDPRERAQAIGIWSAVIGLSMALGPVVGGTLVETVGWRSIFWVNVPVGAAAIALTTLFVPESRAPRARKLDPVGQLLVIAVLGSLTYGIIGAPGHGWTSGVTLGLFGFALMMTGVLVSYERRRVEPLIDVRFFGSAPFSGATVTAVVAFGALGTFLFLNTLYLQDARHLSPLDAGLWTLPMAAMVVLFAPISGRLVGRFGARPSLVGGGLSLTCGAYLLTSVSPTTPIAHLFASYLLIGVGHGLINAPITNTAVSGMPASQAGVAAAITSTSRQTGSALGVAIAGAVAVPAATGASALEIASASHAAWWMLFGSGMFVAMLGLMTTTRWASATADRVAAQFSRPPAVAAASGAASTLAAPAISAPAPSANGHAGHDAPAGRETAKA
jgi:EmrB/QacA subfamily drug resistance transporter